jgi:hypothetical protein
MVRPVDAVARVGGGVLGLVFGAAAAVRRTKPLHPRGVVARARIERTGVGPRWGVPWLDDGGFDEGFVRMSRAVGLPAGWPDVLGLAVSFSDAEGRHDLLLATTGMAPVLRHVLMPRVDPLSASYCSLFPYATPRGRAMLAATPGPRPRTLTLHVASVLGDWHPFATLRLEGDPMTDADEPIDLDPVLNPLPGLKLVAGLAALREPAYAAARRMRPDSGQSDVDQPLSQSLRGKTKAHSIST